MSLKQPLNKKNYTITPFFDKTLFDVDERRKTTLEGQTLAERR